MKNIRGKRQPMLFVATDYVCERWYWSCGSRFRL